MVRAQFALLAAEVSWILDPQIVVIERGMRT